MSVIMERVLQLAAEHLKKYPVVMQYLRKAEQLEAPKTMNVYLKIKIKSLTEEAKLIRTEEQRTLHRHKKWRAKVEARKGTVPPDVFFNLKAHRQAIVRPEARCAHLAYGFLRGNTYRQMEAPTTRKALDWKRVETLITKYGEGDIRDRMQTFSAWKEAA